MKVVVDMNLSPRWVEVLHAAGIEAVHWSDVGDARASDDTLMAWARDHHHVVFTHDLDFSTLLAHTHADGPSVLQLRDHDVLPASAGDAVTRTLRDHAEALAAGAVVTLDARGARVRVLPLRRAKR